MRRRNYSYSPSPPGGYGLRHRGPTPRSHYSCGRELPTSLLICNLHHDCRKPCGFSFVQFLDPADAADVKYEMDGYVLLGREMTILCAEENRKKPAKMSAREHFRSRAYDWRHSSGRCDSQLPRYPRSYSQGPNYFYYRHRCYSRSISPRDGSRSNRGRSYSGSLYGSPYGSRSPS